MDGMTRGKPFFLDPPPDMLENLAFDPSSVQERGWVLLFNAYLTTVVSLGEPRNTSLCKGLQWNTWMCMEDSSVLLEPSELNVQALILVSCHGQELITPSLCWTLIGHACLMSQSLALHLPSPAAPIGSKAYEQRICLFWSLFVIDKSLSLAFGRPAMLPDHLHKDVPMPNSHSLAQFRPHESQRSPPTPIDRSLYEEATFGATHFLCARELAKLQGHILDILYRGGKDLDITHIASLKGDLDTWMERMQNVSQLSSYARDVQLIPSVYCSISQSATPR